jgi:hypothetical protein
MKQSPVIKTVADYLGGLQCPKKGLSSIETHGQLSGCEMKEEAGVYGQPHQLAGG